jgi:hypothetical protein
MRAVICFESSGKGAFALRKKMKVGLTLSLFNF